MPTTINGVGTHYYGKKNSSFRVGACRSCGRVGNLESYDTRLYFVVFFIPIVPMGRKRIIDSCPVCRRHFVSGQDEYHMARQLSLSGAREQYRTDPTPDSAIQAHAQMLGFHAHEEASSFSEEVLTKFPNDASLAAALASQLDEVGEYNRATPLFERAFQLDQNLPAARNGMALRKIVDHRLDDARQLLDFLERPGAGQIYPLGRLEQLAEAFQKAGRHEETLAIAEHLIREFPEVANHHQFRAFVRKSEKATRRATPVLPARKASIRALFDRSDTTYSSSQRWATFLGIAVVLVAAGMAILNEYRRQHRTVIVQNEFGPAAQVVIDGQLQVPQDHRAEIVLAEGTHHVAVSGVLQEEFDVNINSDYWQRWTYDPVWIVNVGGAGQVVTETLVYAENPRPSITTLRAGENLIHVPHVDYLFVNAPGSIRVENKRGEIVKQRVGNSTEKPVDVFLHVAEAISPEAGMRYAESRLLINPNDDELAAYYVNHAAEHSQTERARQFLQAQLDKRPVRIGLHRVLHEMHPTTAEKLELINKYDALLAQEPNNAALLYLRGRLTPDHDTANEYFNRSISADPQLHYPWMALGYHANTLGDWKKCKQYLERSLELKQDEAALAMLETARLGLGEGRAMEREYREQLNTATPYDSLRMAIRLANLLAAQGDLSGAKQVVDEWEAKSASNDQTRTALASFRSILEFLAEDLSATEARLVSGMASPDLKLGWMLVSDKPAEAAVDPELQPLYNVPWNALALSLAFDLAGQTEEADAWRNRAADALAKLDFDEVAAGEILRADEPPSRQQLDNAGVRPEEKAILLAALATHFPQRHEEFAQLAQIYDVQAHLFRPLVRKAIAREP